MPIMQLQSFQTGIDLLGFGEEFLRFLWQTLTVIHITNVVESISPLD